MQVGDEIPAANLAVNWREQAVARIDPGLPLKARCECNGAISTAMTRFRLKHDDQGGLTPREQPKQDGASHPLVPMKSLIASAAQQ